MKKTFKRTAAAVLAVMTVCGTMPAIPGGVQFIDLVPAVSAAPFDVTYVDESNVLHLVGEFNGTDTTNSIDKALANAGKSKDDILKIVAETGAKFPANSGYLFSDFGYATEMDLSKADTSSTTNMRGMFQNCTSLTDLDVSGFDTSNVTIAYDMFFNCSSLTTIDLSSFDTSKIIDMGGMFSRCSSLSSIDLSGFVTTGVTGSFAGMFSGCSSLTTLDLSSFDTSNVKSIHSMFFNCSSLTSLDLSGFDTSSLISADHLFTGCSSLTSVDLTGFDTSKIGFMSGMFYGCSSLTELDLSDFDTGTVTNTERMFYNCSSLKTILVSDKWSTAAVTDSAQMFTGCTAIVGGKGTAYDSAKTDAEYARIDGRSGSKGYLTDIAETVTYVDTSNVLHLVGEFNGTDTTNSIDKALANAGKAKTDITEIVAETGAKFPADSSSLFYQFSNVTDIDLSNASTVDVTDMSFMFGYCSKLKTLDVSGFDTSGVTDIHSMFFNCFELESLDLSGFDTSKVTNMTFLFNHCYSMTSLDLTGLDTSSVTNMSSMFYDCASLQTLDVSHFDTSRVTRMEMMFTDCSALTSLDLSGFDTTNVTDMNTMFAFCSELTSLDLSDFDTSKVEKMDGMFGSCSKLKTITVSDKWTTDQVTNSGLMFTDCTAIVGGNGTVFDSTKTDAEYAVIDGKGGKKGYLTGDLVKVTGLSLDKTSLELTVGDTATLTAEVIPDNADNRNVSWKTSSPAIATVTDGVVTATGVGMAVITATSEDGGYKVTCVVNVTPVPDVPAPSLPVVVSASPKIGTGGVGTGEARAEENYTFSAVAMNNTLVWDSLPGADKFIISARKKGDTQWKRVGTTDSMEYDLSGMEAGTYTFIVRYVKGDFTAPARLSARVNAKVGSNKPVVTAKTADGKVILRWKAVPGADKYRIYTFTDGRLKKVGDTAKTSVRVKGEKGERFVVKAYVNGKWSKVTKKDIASAE
ncbi:MAG: BspA family leucine-rich repeat surface protein [Oscillospiraceae bacterium]|nr:BspA family leucine-rich repeat surface protein [Oscillospiraceae bacterium]